MGTHPIFESDFDCLTEKTEMMRSGEDSFAENNRNNSRGRFGTDGTFARRMLIPKNRHLKMDYSSAEYSSQFDCCDWKCDPSKPGNFPYFITLITIVDIAVFTAYYWGKPGGELMQFNWDTICTPLIMSPWHRAEFWRYFLYQFNHAGITHLASNMVFQIVIGGLIEVVHGSWAVMGVYFSGVLAGSMTGLALSPDKMTVGASGGDYALVFAYLANLIINWDSMVSSKPWKWCRLAFLCGFIGLDIWSFVSSTENKVSVGGHLGGAIVGLTLGLFVLENFYTQDHEKIISRIALGIFIAFMVGSIIFQVLYPAFKANDAKGPPCSHF